MKRILWIAFVCLALMTAAAPLISKEAEHWWERIPLFWAFYTFFGASFLTLIARALGRLFIQKPEDYEP